MSNPRKRQLRELSKLRVKVGKLSKSVHWHSMDGKVLPSVPERSQPLGMTFKIRSKNPVLTRIAAAPESSNAAAPIGWCELKSTAMDRASDKNEPLFLV